MVNTIRHFSSQKCQKIMVHHMDVGGGSRCLVPAGSLTPKQWIWLDWLGGFATHQPVDYCGWNFTILLSYTSMMCAFHGLKRTFSGLTLEFSGWKQGGFLPHQFLVNFPNWLIPFLSVQPPCSQVDLLGSECRSLPHSNWAKKWGMLMIDGWRLLNFMTAIDMGMGQYL